MKDRIFAVMNHVNMNQQQFSNATGIPTSSLSSIFNGRTKPTLSMAQSVHAAFPEINSLWLVFGEGEMLLSSSTDSVTGSTLSADNTQPSKPQPTLFDDLVPDSVSANETDVVLNYKRLVANTADVPVREVVKYVDKPQRKIVEIRIFFDDGTYETFSK